MLRLYLTPTDGIWRIPCPTCGQPLLLGQERRGYWRIGYRQGFSIRPGKRALLVCPDLDCGHVEEAEVAATPADAVVYNPWHAAMAFQTAWHHYDMALSEVWDRLKNLADRYKQTTDPRIPSAIRFWKEEYSLSYWSLYHPLQRSLEQQNEVVCIGKDSREQGRVLLLMKQGLLLERQSGEAIYLSLDTLVHIYAASTWKALTETGLRFDFGSGSTSGCPAHPRDLPTRYAVVGGYSLQLNSVSPSGICEVSTRDPKAARALDLWNGGGEWYSGEFPAAVVERIYRVVRYAHVAGHRVLVTGQNDFGWVRVQTHRLEAAQALRMNRSTRCGLRRRRLRWWKDIPLDEITLEVIEIPVGLPRYVRQVR